MKSGKLHWQKVAVATVAAAFLAGIIPAAAARADQSVGGVEGADGTGSIKGVVLWTGKTPSPKPIRMTTDPYCAKAHAGKKPPVSERYLFGKQGDKNTLQNVFVWVSKGVDAGSVKTPDKPAVLDQDGCVYRPHVAAVMVNQPLQIKNSDSTLHNVNGTMFKKNPPFNIAQPVKGMVENRKMSTPEMGVLIRCDVHPWMNAYLHVVETPFHAVTGEPGTYEIKGLAPGEYEVSVWHEFSRFAADAATKKIKVEAGKAAELDFTFDVKPKN